jgi:hypothetical protein
MSRISTYEVVPVPKLADKLIGTSVGGVIEDITYNFTLLELLNLFLPNIPANNLQGVLDYGNTATQDIVLYGTIYTTNLEVTNTATLLDSYLNGDTHILGALYDVNGLQGTANQVLTSTGTGVEWVTLPPIFTPNLQQVLAVGNTANLDIILSANIVALDINVDTATVNNNITIDGTITDGYSSVGTLNQVLSSTGTEVKWVNLPVYSATSPLFFNNITGVFSIQKADGTHDGYLSSADWITFDGKQNAGNYITALTGEATATGPGSVAITLSNPAVTGKVLTGLNVTGGSISAADSILTAFGKVQGQLNGLVGGVFFKGSWNALINNPTLTSSVGTQGWYYIVSVAGNTNLNGITDWQVGDWAIFNGTTWDKIDNTDSVTSVNGQIGAVSLTTDNITEGATNLYFTDTRARNSVSATTPLAYNNISGVFSIQVATTSQDGYLTSTDWTTFNSKQNALSGTGLVKSTSGTITYITDNSSNWNTAYNDSIVSAAVTGTITKTLTLNQQDGGTITASWSDIDTGLTSVGVSMPSAFSVANSPLTSNGTIAVTGAGTASQYIRGDGQLATFPTSGGGGNSVSYYLNGGTSQGTIGGNPYEEMSRTAVVGTNADFTININGYVANFVTDAGDPALLQIPAGNWNFEVYFSASSNGGTPSFYVELYKYDGAVLTLIASNSANPEGITGGTSIDLYLTALAVPQTSLTITDRLAIRVYVNNSGRTITLHTQGTHLCQVITTFSTGIVAINGLTEQVQYFATGTAGVDFAINSLTNTHTFNLPTASATNRGALSSADWTTFNNKANALSGTTNTVSKFTSSTTIGDSNIKDNGNAVTINTTAGSFGALQVGDYNGGIMINKASSGASLIFKNTLSLDKLWDINPIGDDLSIDESNVGGPRLYFKAGGNIGVSTITPSSLLDVAGTFGATGIVTLGNLAGSGSRMVIASSTGVLSTQAITAGTVTAVTASSPLASSGGNTPDISIPAATTSVNGYLTSTDWTTFNNKQAGITLTTTGTSGAATFVSNTLNIPDYGGALTGYVPYTGATGAVNLGAYNLTVNGISVGIGAGTSGINTAVGSNALGSNTIGSINTAMGYSSLVSNTTGSSNTAIGYKTLETNSIGSDNTAIGDRSLNSNVVSNNTAIGSLSLYINNTGTNNTAIGYGAGNNAGVNSNTSGSNNIFIGYNSIGTSPTDSNKTWIGNLSTTQTWLGGNLIVNGTTISNATYTYTLPLATGTLALVGGVGVGTVTSVAALTLGTSGTDLSSTVANGTTTPVITLNVPTASAANRGALSSADWTTFNNKFNLPSLTSGSVLFSNGTTIAQDNANFFWDDTNNRLGIGTTAPVAALDVLKTSSTLYAPLSEASRFPTASQIYLNNSNAASNSFSGITFQVTRASGINSNAYIGAISTTVNPDIVFGQRDGSNTLYAEKMRITSGGNVGIGTTTPNLIGVDKTITINSTTGTALELNIGDARAFWAYADTNASKLGDFRNFPLEFFTNNSEKMRIFANGNVGINTTADDTQKLQINGNLSLKTAGSKLLIATGTNASAGTTAAMTAGTITVNTTAALTASIIILTAQTTGGTAGALRVSSRTNATSFVITSSSASDTSTVGWLIIN